MDQPQNSFALILPAAGRSERFGRDKLSVQLGGKAILARAIEPFLAHPRLAQVIIAASDQQAMRRLLSECKIDDSRIVICSGGKVRAQSVQLALREVRAGVEWVAIHDAARPLISAKLLDRVLAAAIEHGAAAPAMKVQLTVKQAHGPLPAAVQRTIPRETLWAMQTPQVVRRQELEAACQTTPLSLDQVTDDLQLIELAGGEVWLVDGEEKNIKLTTPLDLKLAELMLGEP